MPKARRELLDSAQSYARSGENRLTEILATVLAAHGAFAAEFMQDVGLPVGDRFDVLTQCRFDRCIPDLVVRSLRGASGAQVSELWSEHKTVSGFRHEQREDYVAALADRPGATKLLTITRDHADGQLGAWVHRSWQHVGELADRVGRRWRGPQWRDAALLPDAPARERLLHELLWYLEEEGFAVVRPLTEDDVRVFGGFVDTLAAVAALMDAAADAINDALDPAAQSSDDALWFHVAPPRDAWLHRVEPHEAYCEVMLCMLDGWSPARLDGPAVGAGYTLDSKLHAALSADVDWVERLERAGFCLEVWDGWVRCWRTKSLSDFVGAGTTVRSQAEALARWGRESIEALSSMPPDELDVPVPAARTLKIRERSSVADT